jgi:RNA polymerase primary sigma factor
LLGGSVIIVFDTTIRDYLKEINEASLLSAEDERYLGTLVIEEQDPEARDRLVRSNLRLVVNIAKKYAKCGVSIGDLIEEGNLGLIKAVDYFDPSKGTRFSTYAAWWIKQGIKHFLLKNVQPLHVPTYMVSLINQWRKTSVGLKSKLGRAASVEEISAAMEISARKGKMISKIVRVLSETRDTDGSDGEGEDSLRVTLCDANAGLPEDELVSAEEKEKMLRLLGKIGEREALILNLHYGLNGKKPMTLKEVGERLGLTRERIRQLQKQALVQLYECMNK